MGSIVSVIGLGLMATRGFVTSSIGLVLVGVVLLVVGLLWKVAGDTSVKSRDGPA